MQTQRLHEANEKLTEIAKSIRLLRYVSWSSDTERDFLQNYYSGNLKQPVIHYPKIDLAQEIAGLKQIESTLSEADPLEHFTLKTARSYRAAAEMIEAIGTSRLTELSIQEFGRPDTPLLGTTYTHLSAAKEILQVASGFDHPFVNEPEPTYSAEHLVDYLRSETLKVMKQDTPEFLISEGMTAKAAAGPKKVRLRAGTYYTDYDFEQLFVHEVMTHTLTATNGLAQTHFNVLARGAPRTTMTQEGLATFAEMVSGVMDLRRLERLALRVIAIENALAGADFIDVFEFFIENGQSIRESYLSASRVFRGGFPDKNIIFTKDSVYLEGLLTVHSFFRWAILHSRTDLMHILFCGRLSIDDVFLLSPAFNSGLIVPPKYLPGWYQKIGRLAGTLSFSAVLNKIRVSDIQAHFAQFE